MIPRYNQFLKGKSFLVAITATCLMAFTLLGYDQGVMSCVIGNEVFLNFFGNPDSSKQGDIVACYDLGCVAGSILVYFIGDRIGRRKGAILGPSILTIATILMVATPQEGQSTSVKLFLFIFFRTITGVGMGIISSQVQIIQAELSPASNKDEDGNVVGGFWSILYSRGSLLTMQGTVTIFGLVVAYWIGYATSFHTTSFEWRFPIAFQLVFSISVILMALMLPDTPRWLLQKGRREEALKIVADLYDKSEDADSTLTKIFDIQCAIDEENKDGPFKFKEFFEMKKYQNFRRILLSIGLMFMQQFSGSNFLNYYAPVIYQTTLGFSQNTANILGGCTSITYLIGSIIPVFLMDRFGRRPLLMICVSGLSLCFILVAILLSFEETKTSYAAIVFIFIYQIVYGLALLAVAWFYTTEINITRLRSKAASIGSAFNWLFVYVIVKITPIINEKIKWKSFIIFAVLNACFLPVIFAFYPETADLELEDIDLIFQRGGLTGGVWETRGRTIKKNAHLKKELKLEQVEKASSALVEHASNSSEAV